MDTVQLCKRLRECTYVVIVLDSDRPINSGSAVAISDNGILLTAAHVISRLPIREEDLVDPNISIFAGRRGQPYKKYKPGITGPSASLEFFKEPLTIDMAILLPLVKETDVPSVKIYTNEIEVGRKVLMAGYPDEMELPFSFDKLLDKNHPEVKGKLNKLAQSKPQLMIKSGMIGSKAGFVFGDQQNKAKLTGEIFYIDNAMHSGASGGPIINMSGQLVGIITERAITAFSTEKTPGLRVPSGSAVAITPRTMLPYIEF